MFVCPGA